MILTNQEDSRLQAIATHARQIDEWFKTIPISMADKTVEEANAYVEAGAFITDRNKVVARVQQPEGRTWYCFSESEKTVEINGVEVKGIDFESFHVLDDPVPVEPLALSIYEALLSPFAEVNSATRLNAWLATHTAKDPVGVHDDQTNDDVENPYGLQANELPYPEECVFFLITGRFESSCTGDNSIRAEFEGVAIVVAPIQDIARQSVAFDACMSQEEAHKNILCYSLTDRPTDEQVDPTFWRRICSCMEAVRDGRKPPLALTDITTFFRELFESRPIAVAPRRTLDIGATLWVEDMPSLVNANANSGFIPRLQRLWGSKHAKIRA